MDKITIDLLKKYYIIELETKYIRRIYYGKSSIS